jgi:membrane-associated protease RseP (regulator of RpoE activity)
MLVLHTLSALLLINTLYILIVYKLAKSFGISIREINLGGGPTLHQDGIFRLKLIPSSASVTLKDSRLEDCTDTIDAFNHQSIWKQLAISLLPFLLILCLGLIVLGKQGFSAFYSSFYQVFWGALAPFSTAQDYLDSFLTFASQHSILEVYGLILIKASAYNFIPLPGLAGWLAIMQLTRMGNPEPKWQAWITKKLAFISILIWLSWLIAFIYWGYRYFFS